MYNRIFPLFLLSYDDYYVKSILLTNNKQLRNYIDIFIFRNKLIVISFFIT